MHYFGLLWSSKVLISHSNVLVVVLVYCAEDFTVTFQALQDHFNDRLADIPAVGLSYARQNVQDMASLFSIYETAMKCFR